MRTSVVLLAAALLLGGCRSVRLPEFEPREDDEMRRFLFAYLIPAKVPAGTVQRWVVESRGVEVVFTLYLRACPPATLEAAVLSDMGGTLAEMVLRDGKVEVRRSSRLLPADLAERLLRDIAPLFLPGSEEQYELGAMSECLALRRSAPLAALHRGDRVWVPEGGRTAAMLSVSWHWDWEGEVRKVAPQSLSIEGFAGGYTATVDVAPWEGSS